MPKVLYLEDEHFLGRIVSESLQSRGFELRLVTDGARFMSELQDFKPDICILDIRVPNIDGIRLAQMVREQDRELPLIFLSAKTQTKDVLEGFRAGGNDYLKKPFSMEELILRLENLLALSGHKKKVQEAQEITLGKYRYFPARFTLDFEDHSKTLSHRENELLKLLVQRQGEQVARTSILKEVWGDDSWYHSRNLDVYIRKLRIYLQKDPSIQLKTLRGFGYYFHIAAAPD